MLERALEGLEEALRYQQVKVKINCVPMANVNEGQWTALAGLAKDLPVDVRFIEMMPIGLGKKYHGRSQEDILTVLRKAYGRETIYYGKCGNGPSVYVEFRGFKGRTVSYTHLDVYKRQGGFCASRKKRGNQGGSALPG